MWEAAWRFREGSGESLVFGFLPWTPQVTGQQTGEPDAGPRGPHPCPGSAWNPQLTTLLPGAESQRPTSGGTRRHDCIGPRHIATLTLRDPRARLGFRARGGNNSGNPKPLL